MCEGPEQGGMPFQAPEALQSNQNEDGNTKRTRRPQALAFILKTLGSSLGVLSRVSMLSDPWALRAMSEGVGSLVLKDLRSVQAERAQPNAGWSSFVS